MKNNIKTILIGLLVLGMLGSIAYASYNPTQIANGSPLILGAQYATPTTGATITISSTTSVLTINPSGSLLALTLAFPGSPSNGQIVFINTTQAVGTVTYSGGTFVGGLASFSANGTAAFVYSSGDSSWHRQIS